MNQNGKNRMQLHKNQFVTVIRNLFCAMLTETWISDSYGVRFRSTSGQNVCDDQMLQRILSQGTFGELFLRSSFRNLYRNFLNEHSKTHFENIHKVPAMDLMHHHNRGLCISLQETSVMMRHQDHSWDFVYVLKMRLSKCSLRKFLYKFLNVLLKKISPKVPYERIL